MREDLVKLDRLDAQTRFLAANGIESVEQLAAKQAEITKRMEALTTERQELYSEIRRISRAGKDPAEQKSMRDEISTQLKELRKDLRLCDGIAERSAQTREELERFLDEQKRDERKRNERNHER